MVEDNDLLMAAASAAGMEAGVIQQRLHRRCDAGWTPWNPLDDDGDALRLAVRMEMDVFVRAGRWTEAVAPMGEAYKAMHDGRPDKATRRAIVMAAVLKPNGNPGDWAARMRAKLDKLREYQEAGILDDTKTPNVKLKGGPGDDGS